MSKDFKLSDDLFRNMADEATIAFTVFKEGDSSPCLYMNKLALSLFELADRDASLGIELVSFFPKEKTEGIKSFSNEILVHEGFYQDIMVRKTNGVRFLANLGVSRITSEGESLLLLMFQDVTLQKKLQRELTAKQVEIQNAYQELLEQNKQLKELDIAKNRFIALTTHELRTPLSAMIGSSELLKEKLYDTDEQHDEFVEMIYDQGMHLLELVNDILDFAKIQNNKMDYYISEQNLLELLDMLDDQFGPMAKEAHVEFKLNFSEKEYSCYYDELRLKQVLSNIVSNAIKYNKEGGQVEISAQQDEDFVEVFVKDTGKGIAKEDQQNVFNEFETLGKVANHQKGTGLGMPISKRLIESMGGSIKLESELGVGTTFSIKVPKKKVLTEENYRERTDTFDLASA